MGQGRNCFLAFMPLGMLLGPDIMMSIQGRSFNHFIFLKNLLIGGFCLLLLLPIIGAAILILLGAALFPPALSIYLYRDEPKLPIYMLAGLTSGILTTMILIKGSGQLTPLLSYPIYMAALLGSGIPILRDYRERRRSKQVRQKASPETPPYSSS